MAGTPAKVKQILERIDKAMSQTAAEVRFYIKQHSDFAEIGDRMLHEWEKGSAHSLRPTS